jgi:hypothetical protein
MPEEELTRRIGGLVVWRLVRWGLLHLIRLTVLITPHWICFVHGVIGLPLLRTKYAIDGVDDRIRLDSRNALPGRFGEVHRHVCRLERIVLRMVGGRRPMIRVPSGSPNAKEDKAYDIQDGADSDEDVSDEVLCLAIVVTTKAGRPYSDTDNDKADRHPEKCTSRSRVGLSCHMNWARRSLMYGSGWGDSRSSLVRTLNSVLPAK